MFSVPGSWQRRSEGNHDDMNKEWLNERRTEDVTVYLRSMCSLLFLGVKRSYYERAESVSTQRALKCQSWCMPSCGGGWGRLHLTGVTLITLEKSSWSKVEVPGLETCRKAFWTQEKDGSTLGMGCGGEEINLRNLESDSWAWRRMSVRFPVWVTKRAPVPWATGSQPR